MGPQWIDPQVGTTSNRFVGFKSSPVEDYDGFIQFVFVMFKGDIWVLNQKWMVKIMENPIKHG